MEEYDKTRLIRRSAQQPPPPPPVPAAPPADDFEKTRLLPREEAAHPLAHSDEDKTVILTPPLKSRLTPGAVNDPMADPVVGWLVVIAGPGQGQVLRLGHGMNSIGRAENQRCRLDFGDTEISRNSHATVTYDPRGRKFYLMHGGGQNLTYLGETPVLQPTLLDGGELISLGKTTLKFVALCGPGFDWSQQSVAPE